MHYDFNHNFFFIYNSRPYENSNIRQSVKTFSVSEFLHSIWGKPETNLRGYNDRGDLHGDGDELRHQPESTFVGGVQGAYRRHDDFHESHHGHYHRDDGELRHQQELSYADT